jgi:aldehyde dehydrogenase (NAD+)
MKQISTQYINGKFVPSHGTNQFGLINPSSNTVIGQLSLADQHDTQDAISAAKAAFKDFSKQPGSNEANTFSKCMTP